MSTLNRREFFKVSTLGGGGMLLSMQLGGSDLLFGEAKEVVFQPSAWLKIFPDNRMVFVLDRTEMGQGVITALPMMLCEELEVRPEDLIIEHAPAAKEYILPEFGMQITGGSTSVRTSYEPLRKAGATARQMFVQAASLKWGKPVDQCYAENGRVLEKGATRSFTYGELVADAIKQPIPTVTLKDPKDFRVIGKSRTRLDGPSKVTGTAVYGIDVRPDETKAAYIVRSPYVGGALESFDAKEASATPGVIKIFKVKAGVAIVAEKYWQARKAAELVKTTWKRGSLGSKDTKAIYDEFREGFKEDGKDFLKRGDAAAVYEKASTKFEAEYTIPYMAHATLEPQNCTAYVRKDRCDVWAPTQGPDVAQYLASEICGLALDKVFVHQTLIGGGFGRRLAQDYVVDAVEISKACGLPVKMVMTREDDMKNDVYRPGNVHRLKASLGADGKLQSWSHKVVGPSIMAQLIPEWGKMQMPSWLPVSVKDVGGWFAGGMVRWRDDDETSVEGAHDHDYQVADAQVSYVCKDPGVPLGFWRSVGHSFTGFVVEGFIDECAHAAKQDPYEYRRSLLKDPKRIKVLDLAAEKSGWKDRVKDKRALGIAQTFSFHGYVAQVVEVEVAGSEIKVKKVVCVIDCGLVVNPDSVKAQIESAVIFGLSAALKDGISFKDGSVEQANFDDFRILRIEETPEIEVHLVQEPGDTPRGVGEPAVPPLAPAIANAVFAATGKRLRELPLRV